MSIESTEEAFAPFSKTTAVSGGWMTKFTLTDPATAVTSANCDSSRPRSTEAAAIHVVSLKLAMEMLGNVICESTDTGFRAIHRRGKKFPDGAGHSPTGRTFTNRAGHLSTGRDIHQQAGHSPTGRTFTNRAGHLSTGRGIRRQGDTFTNRAEHSPTGRDIHRQGG
eukprot:1193115-Prorocentrum_minimum.AAC.1